MYLESISLGKGISLGTTLLKDDRVICKSPDGKE